MTPSKKWQVADRGPQPAASGGTRAKRAFGLLVAILVLTGAVAAWLFLLGPAQRPDLDTFAITEYTDPHVPVEALARKDSEALLTLAFRHQENPFDCQERALFLAKLHDLGKQPKQQTLVVHVAARALANQNGVFILPADASVDDQHSWIPVSDVLDAVAAGCPARHKLLLLDLMQPTADARLGQLVDDIATRVEPLLKEAVRNDPRLWIIAACSPGQVALVSEDMRQSVFGFYTVEGMRGWADGYNPQKKRNRRVSVSELAGFVRGRVARWARRNRNADQTPLVVAGKDDFDLVVLSERELRPTEENASVDPYPEGLAADWKLCDEARLPEKAGLVSPRLVRRLEASLVRAEKRWRGGWEPAAALEGLERDVAAVQDQLARPRPDDPPAHSLALLEARGLKVDPDMVAALRTLAERFGATPPPTPKEADSLRLELQKKFAKAAPMELCAAVWAVAADQPALHAEAIHFLSGLVGALPPPSGRFVETLFLERLAGLQVQPNWWPAAACASAIKAIERCERAAAAIAAEPRTLPWARPALASVDAKRRAGEKILLAADVETLAQAAEPLQDAARTADQVVQTVEALSAAFRAYDDALRFLPADVDYLAALPDEAVEQEKDSEAAFDAAIELGKLLEPPAQPVADVEHLSEPLQRIRQRTVELNDELLRLRAPFTAENVQPLLAMQASDAHAVDAVLKIDRLLEAPLVEHELRVKLWQHRRELSQKLHQQTREVDQQEDDPKSWKATDAPESTSSRTTGTAAQPSALRRAQLVVELLRLGRLTEVPEALAAAAGPVDVDALGRKLAIAWGQTLPRRLHDLLDRRDLAAADLLSRALHPFDRDVDDVLTDPERNPALLLYRDQKRDCWAWFAERCRAEAHSLAAPGSYGDFLLDAADKIARSAR